MINPKNLSSCNLKYLQNIEFVTKASYASFLTTLQSLQIWSIFTKDSDKRSPCILKVRTQYSGESSPLGYLKILNEAGDWADLIWLDPIILRNFFHSKCLLFPELCFFFNFHIFLKISSPIDEDFCRDILKPCNFIILNPLWKLAIWVR